MKDAEERKALDHNLDAGYAAEYKRSRMEYENMIADFIANPLTQQGESYYPTTQSGLEGRKGYFEPHGDYSFYEIDNPYPENDEEHVELDLIKERVARDKKKWQIAFLDLMGAGAGREVADEVISANLVDKQMSEGHTHVAGDCLSEAGSKKLHATVESYLEVHEDDPRPAVLHTVFWRPLRAMVHFRYNLYALTRIFEELAAWYKIQPVGGRIYFQVPSPEVLDLFEEMLRDNGAAHVLRRHPTGSLVTRIIKDEKVSELPTFSEGKYSEKLLAICLRHQKR